MQRQTANQQSGYVIEDSESEIVRLIDQDHVMTEHLGLFPISVEQLFPLREEHAYCVLDLASGPGGWANEVAFRLPEVEVIGVDVAPTMVEYATMRAQLHQCNNVRFRVMDITSPLDLPDASIDYIQARFLVGVLRPEQWLPLVQECRRVLVPGGTLCLIESEWPLTTSPAYEQFTALTSQALLQTGRSLSPDGRHFGVTPRLSGFLREAGFQDVESKAVALDWSQDSELHASSVLNARFAFALLQPFLLSAGVLDELACTSLDETMLDEPESPDFAGLATPLVVWGTAWHTRPKAGERRGDREAQDPHVPKTHGDTRPGFAQLLIQHRVRYEQVAERAGVDEEQARSLFVGEPIGVGSVDALLAALSELTGWTYTRLNVGQVRLCHETPRVAEEPPSADPSS